MVNVGDDRGWLIRLPKLALVAVAAMVGIGLAEGMVDWYPSGWCYALAAAVAWFGWGGRRLALLAVVVMGFGLAHALVRFDGACFPLADRLAGGERVEVTVVGVVGGAPVAGAGGVRFPLDLERLWWREDGWRMASELRARWRSSASVPLIECGDRVVVRGWLTPLVVARNPGEFDAAVWFGRQGMVAELEVEDGWIERPAAGAAGAGVVCGGYYGWA